MTVFSPATENDRKTGALRHAAPGPKPPVITETTPWGDEVPRCNDGYTFGALSEAADRYIADEEYQIEPGSDAGQQGFTQLNDEEARAFLSDFLAYICRHVEFDLPTALHPPAPSN